MLFRHVVKLKLLTFKVIIYTCLSDTLRFGKRFLFFRSGSEQKLVILHNDQCSLSLQPSNIIQSNFSMPPLLGVHPFRDYRNFLCWPQKLPSILLSPHSTDNILPVLPVSLLLFSLLLYTYSDSVQNASPVQKDISFTQLHFQSPSSNIFTRSFFAV